MAEWDEIKKLAADFQRLQESDTLQKISERNCIDIIKKLAELKLIDLIYTVDGREFVTPSHLTKEIQDEIHVNGGKMHLHDLASMFNVDYQHVENKAKDLAKSYPDEYFLVLGQVIHSSYKDNLAREINERLQCNGQITIADLSKTIDLPADFISGIVNERLGTIIDGIVATHDPRTFYTSDFIARYRSKISGALSGVSCPTTIASLLKRFDIPERIFLPIAEALIKEGRIDSTIENRLFIPAIYAREQNEWIDNFYRQNSYIEYDVLSRMDIKQPKAFLRKKFNNCIFLKSCCVSQLISAQVESVIEECIATNGWMDLTTILPSILDKDDIDMLIQDVFKSNKNFQASCIVINQVNICSTGFLVTCKNSFDAIMKSKADEHLKEGRLLDYFVGQNSKEDESGNSNAKTKTSTKSDEHDDTWDDNTQGRGSKRDRRKTKGNRDSVSNSQKQPNSSQRDDAIRRGKEETSGEKVGETSTSNVEPTKEDSVQNEPSNSNEKDTNDLTKVDASKDDSKAKKKKDKETIEEDIVEDEPQGKGSKASKAANRRSGGGAGTQGREVRMKNVKKKYIPGNKHNQSKNDDDSDDDVANSRSATKGRRGRASKRSLSPEFDKSNTADKQSQQPKEPLTFMTVEEISEQLSTSVEDGEDCAPEFLESIASLIERDLNGTYLNVAHEVFTESFKQQDQTDQEGSDDIEVVQ